MTFSLRIEDMSLKCLTLIEEIVDNFHPFKLLGVIVDDKLRWTTHELYIKKKLSKGIGMICKAERVLSSDTFLILYNCCFFLNP